MLKIAFTKYLRISALLGLLVIQGCAHKTSQPNIQRIAIATVAATNVDDTARLYEQWLRYDVVEKGVVSKVAADSWGTPNMLGKPFALLKGESGDDVYLRVIEIDWPDSEYKAMTTHGWNAIEIIVENPDQVYQKLLESEFQHIGGPASLGGDFASIRAVQFKGPSEEVFYFTTDTGDRKESSLLTPRVEIDRPFIMVLAGSDARQLTDFYVSAFGAEEAFYIETPINILSEAQGTQADHLYPMSFLRLAQFSNSIEIDGYPSTSGPRPTTNGQLPPGVSITTFSVSDLDDIDQSLFLSKPVRLNSIAYRGNRSVTIVGPAGELIELIEENPRKRGKISID